MIALYLTNWLGTLKYNMTNGALLIMQGETQHNWLHSVPKRKSYVEPRINITLRKAINVDGTNNYYKYNVGTGAEYKWKNLKMEEMSATTTTASSDKTADINNNANNNNTTDNNNSNNSNEKRTDANQKTASLLVQS